MAADTLKSASITNLDTAPSVGPYLGNTSGFQGAAFVSRKLRDNAVPTAGGLVAIGSRYTLVRLQRDWYVFNIKLNADSALDSNAAPTLAVNVGARYSDSTIDGTAVANQGVLISATAFASAVAFARGLAANVATLSVVVTDGAFTGGNWTEAKRQQPLWQALGIAADPGGFIDVEVAISAAAATAAAGGAISAEVEYATN